MASSLPEMQIQRLSLPNHTLPPINFSHSRPFSPSFAPSHQPLKLVCRFNSSSGFCNSAKRVFVSPTRLRSRGGLVMATYGSSAEEDDDEEEGIHKDDSFYMRRCVELAREAIGCTSSNPMVGCVIVKDGKVVGEGFHPKAGQPHAEVFAIRDAGDLAENATAYVSLEPCNHYGRTGPCSEALIQAKVKKVVVGMVDPNPIVASKGLDRLRDAGIDVVVGVEEELCKKLNEAYIHQMLTGKPFLALRYSLSVNGNLLDQLGEGVTECGGYYSKLLHEYDAVLLPASLTGKSSLPVSQEPGAKQPLWIITATNSSPPIQIPSLTKSTTSKLIIFTEKETIIEPKTAQQGIETVVMDRISLDAILEYCKRQGLCSVMLDLRGSFGEVEQLLDNGIEQNMVQKVIVEVLPQWEGSTGGNSLCSPKIERRLKLHSLQSKLAGRSIVLEGYL